MIIRSTDFNDERLNACLERHGVPEASRDECHERIGIIASGIGNDVSDIIPDEHQPLDPGLLVHFSGRAHPDGAEAKIRRNMQQPVRIKHPYAHWQQVNIKGEASSHTVSHADLRSGTVRGIDCITNAQAVASQFVNQLVERMFLSWTNDRTIRDIVTVGKQETFLSNIRRQVRDIARQHYARHNERLPLDRIEEAAVLRILDDTYADWKGRGKL